MNQKQEKSVQVFLSRIFLFIEVAYELFKEYFQYKVFFSLHFLFIRNPNSLVGIYDWICASD